MHEIDRLSGSADWIGLDFAERERTPEWIVELGIQLHLTFLSLSNTKQYLESLGAGRSRTAIHNWVQNADLWTTSDATPNHIAVDETVIQVNNELAGCTPPSIPRRANSSAFGSSRPERRNLPCCLYGNRNST